MGRWRTTFPIIPKKISAIISKTSSMNDGQDTLSLLLFDFHNNNAWIASIARTLPLLNECVDDGSICMSPKLVEILTPWHDKNQINFHKLKPMLDGFFYWTCLVSGICLVFLLSGAFSTPAPPLLSLLQVLFSSPLPYASAFLSTIRENTWNVTQSLACRNEKHRINIVYYECYRYRNIREKKKLKTSV